MISGEVAGMMSGHFTYRRIALVVLLFDQGENSIGRQADTFQLLTRHMFESRRDA